MFVNEPDGYNGRNQGKGPSDNPSHLYTESAENRPEMEHRFTW